MIRDALTFRPERLHKLITHEDHFHVHKTFGVLALAHFMYRAYEWSAYGDTFVTASRSEVLATTLLHMALSGTSLIFKIPQNRVKGAPMIWPEFRAHSIVFAYRSLLAMLAIAFAPPSTLPFLRCALVLGTLLAADTATHHFSKLDNKLGTTMRGMPYPDAFSDAGQRRLNLYYSVSQVLATLHVLYAPDLGTHIVVVFAIQLAALLMTMVRKGVITTAGWHMYYAAALGLNYVYGIACVGTCRMPRPHSIANASTAVAFSILRFKFHVNKYVLWALACVVRELV